MNRTIHLVLLAAALVACGSDDVGGAGKPTKRDTYPTATGCTEGQALENMKFQSPDGSEFSMNTVFSNEKNRVMLLTTTAGWCTACIEEQPKLESIYKELGPKGLIVVAALFEDSDFQPATLEQAQAWVERYKTSYPLILDKTFQLSKCYDRTATPMNMIVDVDDMKILKITTGFDETVVRSVIEANLDL